LYHAWQAKADRPYLNHPGLGSSASAARGRQRWYSPRPSSE
jgi:hypothetical protein